LGCGSLAGLRLCAAGAAVAFAVSISVAIAGSMSAATAFPGRFTSTTARTRAATGAARAARCGSGVLERNNSARGLLVIANPQNPGLSSFTAWIHAAKLVGLAVTRHFFSALLDHGADVDRRICAYDDVVTARTQGIPWPHRHRTVAGVADHLQPAS